MRGRRPELFSDSVGYERYALPDNYFNFVLDSITTFKQEQDFEYFCRRLIERVICPNLTAQTGPTGGGDRKVDSETYPVAEEIAERWYVGFDGGSKERWGFAFSAKKDWRAKLREDVQKAIDTGREYAKMYFVTNQAVRDKA